MSSHLAGAPLAGPTGLLSARELEDIVAALPGFLLVFTAEGKLLYLSESVSEHLGHSMVSAEGALSTWPRVQMGRNEPSTSENLRITWEQAFMPCKMLCQGLALDSFTNGHLFFTFPQVDLVAQGDSIYDIIDPADHLTVRQQLTLPSALDTGENSFLPSSVQPPSCCPAPPHLPSLSAIHLLTSFSLHSPRSPLPLSLQHLQVP